MRQAHYWPNVASYAFLTTTTVAVAYFIGYLNGFSNTRRSLGFPILHEVRALLSDYYLGDLPPDDRLDYGAVRGLFTAIGDPYLVFLEPPSQELETQSLQGEFGGIGVNIWRTEAGEVAMSPLPDYPAIRAGIHEGDILVAVDGVAITPEMTLDQLSALVRGPIGTVVKIRFHHEDQPEHEVTLIREKIEVPSVTGRLLEQDSRVGLVAISRFSEKTPVETQTLLDTLQAQGATGIVLDLRGNGGGLLDSAVSTARLFLDGGVIMYEARRGVSEKTYAAPAGGPEASLPLVVLVNQGTASAAEILAGALRDRGRAPLIGQRTYGKGSVQLIFTLADNSSVHITNSRWYTPNRLQIDGVGLQPDIELQPGTGGADPELDRAVAYLKSLK